MLGDREEVGLARAEGGVLYFVDLFNDMNFEQGSIRRIGTDGTAPRTVVCTGGW